jgi:hypothetical protein
LYLSTHPFWPMISIALMNSPAAKYISLCRENNMHTSPKHDDSTTLHELVHCVHVIVYSHHVFCIQWMTCYLHVYYSVHHKITLCMYKVLLVD